MDPTKASDTTSNDIQQQQNNDDDDDDDEDEDDDNGDDNDDDNDNGHEGEPSSTVVCSATPPVSTVWCPRQSNQKREPSTHCATTKNDELGRTSMLSKMQALSPGL